jgi:hypothetical protein
VNILATTAVAAAIRPAATSVPAAVDPHHRSLRPRRTVVRAAVPYAQIRSTLK